jgi:hypothetical protein
MLSGPPIPAPGAKSKKSTGTIAEHGNVTRQTAVGECRKQDPRRRFASTGAHAGRVPERRERLAERRGDLPQPVLTANDTNEEPGTVSGDDPSALPPAAAYSQKRAMATTQSPIFSVIVSLLM